MQNMSCKIYMDHAATTEMLPQVRKAMEPYLMEEYGNASTSYEMGRRTREALEGAREQIAMLIKAKGKRETCDHKQNRTSCGAALM